MNYDAIFKLIADVGFPIAAALLGGVFVYFVINYILESTGFDEVFTDDSNIDGMNYSDYNSIKDLVHSKLRG